MSKPAEIRALTGLRGAAALFVTFYHLLYGMVSDPTRNDFGTILLRHGYLSVDLFFVLSGYVMALTYAKLFAPGFDIQAVVDFLGRRIGRVYPAYITVTVIVALDRIANTPWHGAESTVALISNALMVQSWGFSDSIVGPSWSVSTEFAAYLVFPLLVGVVLQSRREWIWLSAVASLATLLFIATRSSAMLHQGMDLGSRHGPLDIWGSGTPFLVLRCLAGFVLGLIGFRIAQHPGVKHQAGRMFAGDIAMASVLLLMLVPGSDVALVLLFVPLTVTLAQQRSWSAALLGSPVVHWWGLISYSLYLVHQPIDHYVRTPLFAYFNKINIPHAYTATAIVIFAPIVILAAVSYYGIEKPGRTWSRRLFRVGRVSTAREQPM